MKSNQTPVGLICPNFPKETSSTLAILIKIIADKRLYLLPILWPPEDLVIREEETRPPPVVSLSKFHTKLVQGWS